MEGRPSLTAAAVAMWRARGRKRAVLSRVAAVGHEGREPTLTIWEGVTMYLREAAIEAEYAAYHPVPLLIVPASRAP